VCFYGAGFCIRKRGVFGVLRDFEGFAIRNFKERWIPRNTQLCVIGGVWCRILHQKIGDLRSFAYFPYSDLCLG
jgi:hypothetical protein